MEIARLLTWDAFAMTAPGTIAGLLGTVAATLFVRSRLFGVDSTAAVGIGAAAVVGVLLVIALALRLPVRRATRIDPIDALRYE